MPRWFLHNCIDSCFASPFRADYAESDNETLNTYLAAPSLAARGRCRRTHPGFLAALAGKGRVCSHKSTNCRI